METRISRQRIEDSMERLRVNNALLRGETYVMGPMVVEVDKFVRDRFEMDLLKRKVDSPSNKEVEDVIRVRDDGIEIWRQEDSAFNSSIVFSESLSKDVLVEFVSRGKGFASSEMRISGESLRELLVLVENAAVTGLRRDGE
jgi:hypothetical protein